MAHRNKLRGWLLDLYAEEAGLSLWLLGRDGKRHHLYQPFATKFYIAGPSSQLRLAWKWLASQPEQPALGREERMDLFSGSLPVLLVEISRPPDLPRLFGRVSKVFPDLVYYDADIHLSLRHAAQHGTYPLADCELEVDAQNRVADLHVLGSPWDLDIPRPPLSVITMEPDVDPFHAAPRKVWIQTTASRFALDLEPGRAFLVGLQSVLKQYDPDLILTSWGIPGSCRASCRWQRRRVWTCVSTAMRTSRSSIARQEPIMPTARSSIAGSRSIWLGAGISISTTR